MDVIGIIAGVTAIATGAAIARKRKEASRWTAILWVSAVLAGVISVTMAMLG